MSPTVGAALAAGTRRLAAARIDGAARDARRLMASALGIDAMRLGLCTHEPIGCDARLRFEAHVAARLDRQPVAQILGLRAFWGRDFEVTRDVLDPRPETETLVAAALEGPPATRLLDLGTGSGALLVTLLAAWPACRGVGTDISAAALAVAARNAALHAVGARAEFARGDWFEAVSGRFDLVLCNPPYIPADDVAALEPEVRLWEPALALSPGPRGLEAHERIAAGLQQALVPGGRALLEFGAGQGPKVAAIYRAAGFCDTSLLCDLDGRERAIAVAAALP